MISITLLDGPLTGIKKPMPKNKAPVSVFVPFIQMNWRWQTDYSRASAHEFVQWFRIELIAKITFAFKNQVPVYFLSQKYLPPVRLDGNYLEDIQRLEKIIASSNTLIAISQDDEQKLVIGVVAY